MRLWRRVHPVDEWSEHGEGVVLLPDGRVVATSALGWTIVKAIGTGVMDEAEVVAALVSSHGVPLSEDGRDVSVQLTSAALDELAAQGMVTEVRQDGGPE